MAEIGYESLQRLRSQFSEETLKQDLKREYMPFLEHSKRVYIWGTGLLGRFACKQLIQSNILEGGVIAYIDNNRALAGSVVDDVPVITPDMIETNDLIIICSQYFIEIEMQVKNELSNPCLYYRILPFLYDEFGEWDIDKGLADSLKKLDIYRENYKNVFHKCADEVSKEILDCILNYRFTMKSKWIQKAYEKTNESGNNIEYFDPEIIKPQKNEVFVDCGGYIGDTVLGFLKFVNNTYRKIYYFEPSKFIFNQAKENLKSIDNIVFTSAGVGETAGICKFVGAGQGDFGHIDDNGTETIDIVRLDEIVIDQPTFIKMDIEGAELSALKGASGIIKESKPKLAICVYHKPEDLFEILELIDSWGIHYKYYFRHYNKGLAGTILYCIPQNE
ncbi:MAG: FkbM family methyltransferase [Lachnospiraceae bacterium]|nr:FkbM family methyltransferase [Lachnospiraceae bacterium]